MLLPRTEFDTPWKDILDIYFQAFLELCLPHIAQDIDWTKGYEPLDKELSAIDRETELGKRLVDKLMKVWRKNGEETWVLLHIEVQGQSEPHFPERMYVYNYRLFDRYYIPVVSIAVLADDDVGWRPRHYQQALWGCELAFKFITLKLLDYAVAQQELQASTNPFAVVIVTHLAALHTKRNAEQRLASKLALTRALYEKGFDKAAILNLYAFIDWVMALPEPLELKYLYELERFEEEKRMAYITSAERIGIQKGLQQGLLQGEKAVLLHQLQHKFGDIPSVYRTCVEEADSDTLLEWARLLMEARTLAEIFKGSKKDSDQ